MSTPSLTRDCVYAQSACPGCRAPVIAHVDGCVGPGANPGALAGAGVCIVPHAGVCGLEHGLHVAHPCTGRAQWSNNAAEYEAALTALRVLYRLGWRGPVVIRSDSQLLVRQFNREYGCHEPVLVELLEKLYHAATFFDELVLEWVPRVRNGAADALARRGLESALRRSGRAVS
jgi:ribonuclease HI